MPFEELDRAYDVDDYSDLKRLFSDPSLEQVAPRTAKFLRQVDLSGKVC